MSENLFSRQEGKIDSKIQNEIREKKIGEHLEKFRRGLWNNLEILKNAGEKEKNGELIKREIKNLKGDENKFWKEKFPVLREQFWERQKIPLVESGIEQNKLFNVAGGSLRGEVRNGFRAIGWMLKEGEELDAQGIIPSKKREAEIIVVDRGIDKKLAGLIAQARRIKNELPSEFQEEERVFYIAQLVFKRMGGNNWDKIQAEAGKMWREKRQILVGNIEWGTCLHRSILSQVLSTEGGLDPVLNKNLITEEFKSPITGTVIEVPEVPHAYNLLFLRDGKIIIFDTKHLTAVDERKDFENILGNFGYPEFKKAKKEFPLLGSNKAPFLEARWGVDGLKKLLEIEK